jgi:Protein of unknown function (DUF1236)
LAQWNNTKATKFPLLAESGTPSNLEKCHPIGKTPCKSVTFYAIPREFGVPPEYRYAMVNDEVILVEPRSRRIEQAVAA